jgi:large subunit ribosomal protein L31
MKEKIHPKYDIITVKCACGNIFQTRSTRASFTVDVCSNCHPFYTGHQKVIDSAGKIEKFKRKYEKFQQQKKEKAGKEAKQTAEPAARPPAGEVKP